MVKIDLHVIRFLANHHNSESVRSKLEIALVFTECANTWMITSANVCLLAVAYPEGGTWVNVPPSWIEKKILAPELQTDDCFATGVTRRRC